MVEVILILFAVVISFVIGFDSGKLAGLCEAERIALKYFGDVMDIGDDE